LEILFTKPLSDWDIILGKYFAALGLIFFALVPTLVYYITVFLLGNPVGNIDSAGAAGSYVGLLLLGASFAAVGLFASSLSENQIVAFILAAFMSFLMYQGFGSLAAIDIWQEWAGLVAQLGMAFHYDALSKGLIDSRHVIYFLSLIAVVLMATRLVTRARLW
jgi:ABC-2 type transport system permease protein